MACKENEIIEVDHLSILFYKGIKELNSKMPLIYQTHIYIQIDSNSRTSPYINKLTCVKKKTLNSKCLLYIRLKYTCNKTVLVQLAYIKINIYKKKEIIIASLT